METNPSDAAGARAEPIRFYFDFISHNAYLAWTQMHVLARRYDRTVEPVPVLFAGLLDAHGQLGPAEVPPKALWMARNVLRKAALLGVPLHPPRSHPFNPLLSLRVASLPVGDPERSRIIDRLFGAVWAGGPGVTDPAVVSHTLTEAGMDGDRMVADAQTPEAKQRLRRQTDDAIASGVFGVPTMIVGQELFWGYDDLPLLERFLRGEDPLDVEAAREWVRVRPSAVRPGSLGRNRTAGPGGAPKT